MYEHTQNHVEGWLLICWDSTWKTFDWLIEEVQEFGAVVWLHDIFAYDSENIHHLALRTCFTYVATDVEAEIIVQDLVHEINEHYNKLLVLSCMLKV